MHSGTIKVNGDVVLHGCEPTKTKLMGITHKMIAIKHPGGTYYTNGGPNYCPAWIQVDELATLKPSSKVPGEFEFTLKRLANSITFHPQAPTACRDALRDLATMNFNRDPQQR